MMAHFARVEEGYVRQVVRVENDAIGGGKFPDSEPVGQAFLAAHDLSGLWLQCSFSGAFRSAYPDSGWRYDEQADAFVPPTTEAV